jgi:hypothetical protein
MEFSVHTPCLKAVVRACASGLLSASPCKNPHGNQRICLCSWKRTLNIHHCESVWPVPANENALRLRRRGEGEAGPDFSRPSAYLYLGLFIPVITFVLLRNVEWNNHSADTKFHLSAYDMLERFSSLFSNANSNPLEGLFDIFPHGLRLDMLPNLLGRAWFGPGMSLEFFLICCSVLLAATTTTMARTIGMRWGVSVLAGILLPLMIMPVSGPNPLAEHFYIVSPTSYYSTAGTVLCTALFWRIDDRSWMRFALLTGIIVLVLLHLSMTLIFFIVILAPAMVVMGVAALIASKSRGELLAKIASAAIIVAVLASAGIFHYLYAIGSDTSYHVFYKELRDFMLYSSPSWSAVFDDALYVTQASLNFQASIEGILAPLSQAGALYLAAFGRTYEVRLFGRTMVVWIFATMALFVLAHYSYYFTGFAYKGPSASHYLPILWPYYAICLASLLSGATEGVVWLMSLKWTRTRVALTFLPHGLVVVSLGWVIVFVVTHVDPYSTDFFRNDDRRTPIVDFLQSEIGVSIDRKFRGTVVALPTINERDTIPYYAAYRANTFVNATALFGNDMGQFGLWQFNIPTLNQMTENITPQFHLTVREFLSRPGIDVHQKHHTLITRSNPPIMQLLGLRYIIADYELPIGAQRFVMPFVRRGVSKRTYNSPLRVYELPHPNVGNYSPIKVVHATTAKAIIAAMRDPAFDGRHTVVTDDPSIRGDFVPAADAVMTVRMGGVAARASSSGGSLLVLPVQYSHCWQIVAGSNATLFRANLMQLGIRFTGDLQVELRQIFGPFWQSGCRLTDVDDADRLDMARASRNDKGQVIVRAPDSPSSEPVAGDGENLIPNSEAFEPLFSGAATQISKVAAATEPRVYRLAAAGKHGEHYAISPQLVLSPGSYTVSLEIRPEHVGQVRLWLTDQGGVGPVVDFDLEGGNVKVVRPDVSGEARAGFELIADGWYKIWLTGKITGISTAIYTWLSNEIGSFDFAPRKEAVSLRALQLERGETASPYQPSGAKVNRP